MGGNSRARDFFDSQPDITMGMSMRDKYNSRAAALYRDKVELCGFLQYQGVWLVVLVTLGH